MSRQPVRYFHVDVFASRRLAGNGLAVFLGTDGWSDDYMHELTREMRQFESIFLDEIDDLGAAARIFTMQEELPFAGHPVLGAAAVLHLALVPAAEAARWRLRLPAREVEVTTQRRNDALLAEMDQGIATISPPIATAEATALLDALGLRPGDLVEDLPLQVVSTGLPYLIVPVRGTVLRRAAIRTRDFETQLAAIGARFVYVLDPAEPEGRTWDNLGDVEDVATGSAAGPTAAYLHHHGRVQSGIPFVLHQGRFAGRPSELGLRIDGGRVFVSGEVWPVITGLMTPAAD